MSWLRGLRHTRIGCFSQMVKNLPAMQDSGSVPGLKDPLEKGITTHTSILAWRIPWTEEPGQLQSMGSQSQTRLSGWHTHTLEAWKDAALTMACPACKWGWYSQGQILEPPAVCTWTDVLVGVKAGSQAVTENLGQNLICRQEIGKLQTRSHFLLL